MTIDTKIKIASFAQAILYVLVVILLVFMLIDAWKTNPIIAFRMTAFLVNGITLGMGIGGFIVHRIDKKFIEVQSEHIESMHKFLEELLDIAEKAKTDKKYASKKAK